MSITRGPWKVQPYTLYASQMAPAEYPIHAPKRGLIGKAYKRDDAKCMAASHDLLEALKEAKEALEWVVKQSGGPVCEHESGGAVCFCVENSAIYVASLAIAKATQ